jgi:hypothetical protein
MPAELGVLPQEQDDCVAARQGMNDISGARQANGNRDQIAKEGLSLDALQHDSPVRGGNTNEKRVGTAHVVDGFSICVDQSGGSSAPYPREQHEQDAGKSTL